MAGATPNEFTVETDADRGAYLSPRVDFVILTAFTTTTIAACTVLLLP